MNKLKVKKGYGILDIKYIDSQGKEKELSDAKDPAALAAMADDYVKFYPKLKKQYKALLPKKVDGEPVSAELAMRLGIAEKEPVSDAGNLRWMPNGAFMFDLVRQRYWDIFARSEIIYPIISPVIISKEDKGVKWLVGNFPERKYWLSEEVSGGKEMFLRISSDYGMFSAHRDVCPSYRQLPFGFMECEDDFRYEQSGEVGGLHRPRAFHMQNIHLVCKDQDEAKKVMIDMFRNFYQIQKDACAEPELLVVYSLAEMYQDMKKVWQSIAREYGKPILVQIIDVLNLYMCAWIDFVMINSKGGPIEVGSCQLDVLSAKNWGIKYIDKCNKPQCPVIVHAGVGYERLFASMLERKAMNNEHKFPVWLAPVQVRVVPVGEANLAYARKVANELVNSGVRVVIDDRSESVSKRVRDALKSWIPYIVVLGEKEQKQSKVSLRGDDGKLSFVSVGRLCDMVIKKCKGMPNQVRFGPFAVSKRVC